MTKMAQMVLLRLQRSTDGQRWWWLSRPLATSNQVFPSFVVSSLLPRTLSPSASFVVQILPRLPFFQFLTFPSPKASHFLPLVSLFQMFILPKLFPFSFLIPPPHLCLPFSFQIGNRHPHSPSLTPFLISSPSSAQNPAPLFPSSLFP